MHPATVAPWLSATWVARWMTTPSASGSLNGTPNSIMSAPARAIASTTRSEVSASGYPSGQ
jgi:hypothetical protein